MKLSTRTTYGVRAMLALALHTGNRPLMVREIAEQYRLPSTYLEQLMVLLRKSGLVHSVRGAHGGYSLARHPAEVSLMDIIRVLDGPITLSECPAGMGCCGQSASCIFPQLWREAGEEIETMFRSISLATLIERHYARTATQSLMYDI